MCTIVLGVIGSTRCSVLYGFTGMVVRQKQQARLLTERARGDHMGQGYKVIGSVPWRFFLRMCARSSGGRSLIETTAMRFVTMPSLCNAASTRSTTALETRKIL